MSSLLRQIEQQLDNLQSVNQMQFDYWMSELCDENDELIPEKCNEHVLSQIEKDVYGNDFESALIASGYYFQPETGAYCREDANGNLHSYRQSDENINVWNYQRWVDFRGQDVLIRSKQFTLN